MGRKGISEGDTADDDEPLDSVQVHQIIHENLTRLRHGDLFMEGLGQECYGHLLSSNGGSSEMTDNLTKFLAIIAESMVKEEGGEAESKQARKRRKKYLRVLKLKREDIEKEIRLYEEDKLETNAPNGTTDAAASGATVSAQEAEQGERDATDNEPHKQLGDSDSEEAAGSVKLEEDEDNRDDCSSSHSHRHGRLKKKSKRKKKRRDKEKKEPKKKKHRRSRENLDDTSIANSIEVANDDNQDAPLEVSAAYMAAKERFEQEKAALLKSIPQKVRSRFRQLCFSHWSKSWLPGVEVGPYDVSPGPVRDQWFTMFSNCKRSGRPLTRLVYWYGTPRDDLGFAYSFQQPKNVVSYEQGIEKGYDQIPARIQKKLDAGKRLLKSEEHHTRALEEIKGEVELNPEERLSWTFWREDYELMFPDQLTAGGFVGEGAVQQEETLELIEQVNKKDKKRKKRKKDEELEEESTKKKKKPRKAQKEEEEEENDTQADVKDIKKGQKRPKSKLAEAEEEKGEETKGGKKKGKKRGKPKKDDKVLVEEQSTAEEEELDAADNEHIPSEEDKDGDFQGEPESEIESEGSRESISSPKQQPASKGKKKAEMTEEEKEKDHQEKLARRRERDRKRRAEKKREKEEVKENDPHEIEQKRFEECEKLILPVITRLEEALSGDDADRAEECLNDLHTHIEMITPPFIKAYKVGMAIKKTRKTFVKLGNVKSLCHGLTKELKRVYLEKEKCVPNGFEARKTGLTKDKPDEQMKSRPTSPADRVKEAPAKEEPDLPKDPELSARKKLKEEPVASPKREIKEEPLSLKKPKIEEILPDHPVPKKASGVSLMEQGLQPNETSKAAPQAKPVRKGFSLKGMFERPKPTPKAKEKTPSADRVALVAKAVVKKEPPKWLTACTLADNSLHCDTERSLAMEFFLDAAGHFPSDKVNADAVAGALESAVFDYSQLLSQVKKIPQKESYWELVHDIVASISGKRGPGTIFQKILDGEYASPAEVVKLKRKSLIASFEGLPS